MDILIIDPNIKYDPQPRWSSWYVNLSKTEYFRYMTKGTSLITILMDPKRVNTNE